MWGEKIIYFISHLRFHLLLVHLLHVLTVVLLLKLFDKHCLSVWVRGVLLFRIGFELQKNQHGRFEFIAQLHSSREFPSLLQPE